MDAQSVILEVIYNYGPIGLLPLLMIEGPLMAIAGGFMVGTGKISLLVMFAVYVVSDGIMSNIYFFAGRSSRAFFVGVKTRFFSRMKRTSNHHLVFYLEEQLNKNFSLAYTFALCLLMTSSLLHFNHCPLTGNPP